MNDVSEGSHGTRRPRPRLRVAITLAAASAVAAGVGLVAATSADAATTLGASASATGRYFGAAVAAHKLLPSGAAVVNAWNAQNSGTTGAVRFTNAGYNSRIPAGTTTEFGFQGTGTGPSTTPSCAAG